MHPGAAATSLPGRCYHGMGSASASRWKAGIIHLAVIAALAAFLLPSLAQAAPFQGKLDPSFGNGGRLRVRLAPTFAHSDYATAVLQPDGSLLLGGKTQSVHHYKTPEGGAYIEHAGFIRRLLPNGSPDPSFHEVLEDEPISGPSLQADGKIVFAAEADYRYGEYSGLVHRLDPSGNVDRGYGRNGVSTVLPLRPSVVAVDAEGRTVVAGDAGVGGQCHDCEPRPTTALSRLLPNGALDKSFGKNGTLLLPTAEFDFEVTGLVLAPDGTIFVSSGKAISAVTASGAPDETFGKEGQVEFEGTIGALTRTVGGDLVAAGRSSEGCCGPGLGGFAVRAYLANGALDPAWGSGGTARIAIADVDYGTAVVPTPDGGVMLAGEVATKAEPEGCSASLPCSFEPYVARLTATGAIDPDFSASLKKAPGDGDQDSPLLEAPPRVAAIALTPEGEVLLAGRAEENEEATVAALGPSGARDPSFGSEGVAAEPRPLPSETSAVGFALGGDGALALALHTNADDYAERTELAGFNAAGDPIPEYGGEVELSDGVEVNALGSDAAGHVYGIDQPFGGRARVVRIDGDGRPDPRYGEGGTALLPEHFAMRELLVRGNGAVLAIGRVSTGDPMALFELTPEGRPNPRFGSHGLALLRWGRARRRRRWRRPSTAAVASSSSAESATRRRWRAFCPTAASTRPSATTAASSTSR